MSTSILSSSVRLGAHDDHLRTIHRQVLPKNALLRRIVHVKAAYNVDIGSSVKMPSNRNASNTSMATEDLHDISLPSRSS